MRVLVVEDEILIAMSLEDAVVAIGCEMVGPIADLDQALATALAGEFDCAILDVNIRGGSTFGIADLLRERGCPFLMATGYSDRSIPAHLVGQGRLTKPYSSSALETALRHLLAQVQVESPARR